MRKKSFNPLWALAVAVALTLWAYTFLTVMARANARDESAERALRLAEGERDNALEQARQYREQYNALLLDYADMREANIELAEQLTEAHAEQTAWTRAGEFRIYHYCSCERCCGKEDGVTATGTIATEGRTVAVDPEVIPLGSEVMIGGHVYIAEDTGVTGNAIDVYVNDHAQATAMGTYVTAVEWREARNGQK